MTVNDGLFNNTVFSMATTRDGTLWVGSFGGVARTQAIMRYGDGASHGLADEPVSAARRSDRRRLGRVLLSRLLAIADDAVIVADDVPSASCCSTKGAVSASSAGRWTP